MSGKTGTTESHRSSGFLGFTNQYAAANYIFDDSPKPGGLCSFPLRKCGYGDLYGGKEPARTWFLAMQPIATDFGPIALPPTDPRYVDGGPGSEVPSVTGMSLDAAKKRVRDAGFQVSDQPTPINSYLSKGTIVGTTPKGKTIPGSIITINTSNGIAPAPPPPVYRPSSPNDSGPPPPPPDAAAATGRADHRDSGPAADHDPDDGTATTATPEAPPPPPPVEAPPPPPPEAPLPPP